MRRCICMLFSVLFLSACALPGLEEDAQQTAEVVEEVVAKPQAFFFDEQSGLSYAFRSGDQYLEIYNGEEFVPTYLNGVNIGSGAPGYFPGELAISKEAYSRWFLQIAEMNCNCIRIYTTMMPCFYEALKEYNASHEQKLYLIMGVWYDEDTIYETGDAYDVLSGAVSEAQEQIDIIHGDCVIPERVGRAYGSYHADVSDCVLGWILGIESDAFFVGSTNDLHPALNSYDGEYLYTEHSDAFHAFLCELGDKTIAYEAQKYGCIRPVSWANWPTADMLGHPEEPLFDREDAVTINVEWIKKKESFPAGLFASYHIYPYYPDFMVLEEKYTSYVDANGNVNTYEAYLKDLRAQHDLPILVAEFGVPTSRGCTHQNPYMHFDQGGLDETAQGEALSYMANNIFDSGYCGGLVFTWQDEWFKRTWNTMDYTDSDRRPFWSDIQTSEQNFGLLCFDPGEEECCITIDGQDDDWSGEKPLLSGDGYSLYLTQDARYLYLCVRGEGLVPGDERILIPFDITPLSGSLSYEEESFDVSADFVLDVRGKEDTRLLVHRYYDRYAFAFGEYDNLLDTSDYDDKDSTEFVPVYLCLNRTQKIPTTGKWRDAERQESGRLHYGNGDPASPAYDSLSDFCYGSDFIELRIAWGLLSFRDPSTKEVEGDFWKEGYLHGMTVDGIQVGLCAGGHNEGMAAYSWDNWEIPVYHERLKQSYDILKECFGKLVL